MKYKIKVLVSLIISFFIVTALGDTVRSPAHLLTAGKLVMATNPYLSKLNLVKPEDLTNKVVGTVVGIPVARPASAQVKKTVTYKGKKLEIYVNNRFGKIPDESLEFFYQLQLAKEKRGK